MCGGRQIFVLPYQRPRKPSELHALIIYRDNSPEVHYTFLLISIRLCHQSPSSGWWLHKLRTWFASHKCAQEVPRQLSWVQVREFQSHLLTRLQACKLCPDTHRHIHYDWVLSDWHAIFSVHYGMFIKKYAQLKV